MQVIYGVQFHEHLRYCLPSLNQMNVFLLNPLNATPQSGQTLIWPFFGVGA